MYLYGIRSCADIKKILNTGMGESIGGGKPFVILYTDIEAIVSEVSLEEFGSEEIQRKAIDDLAWIKDKALIHERVIETAINNGDSLIIPMKFGMIFKNRGGLIDSLKKDYVMFKRLFQILHGKEEYSVKVYVKHTLLENEIKKNSPMIQRKYEEMRSLPAGRRYFLEEEVQDIVKKDAKNSLHSYTTLFLERIKGFAEELKENNILGKELTGKNDPMVCNGAFLVKKEKVDRFMGEIQALQIEYENRGFIFESSGPWPAYHFV